MSNIDCRVAVTYSRTRLESQNRQSDQLCAVSNLDHASGYAPLTDASETRTCSLVHFRERRLARFRRKVGPITHGPYIHVSRPRYAAKACSQRQHRYCRVSTIVTHSSSDHFRMLYDLERWNLSRPWIDQLSTTSRWLRQILASLS